MITASSEPDNNNDTSPWGEVVKVCRRICLLRATGHGIEAASVQSTELSGALARIGSHAADPVIAARLSALFAAEEERLADARVLAELLTPMLLEHLRSVFPLVHTEPPPPPDQFTPAPEPARPSRPSPADIADFIDDMLAQERAAPARRSAQSFRPKDSHPSTRSTGNKS